jgi:hypothetical protein
VVKGEVDGKTAFTVNIDYVDRWKESLL